MRRIEELSKEELLSVIHHALPNTVVFDHPCMCAACGDGSINHPVFIGNLAVMPYGYICDFCEHGLGEDSI